MAFLLWRVEECSTLRLVPTLSDLKIRVRAGQLSCYRSRLVLPEGSFNHSDGLEAESIRTMP